MAKEKVLCFLLLAAVIYKTSDAWFINSHWQTKNCFCQVLLNNRDKTLIHDMGSIMRCKEFFGCQCGHYKMRDCMANCEKFVQRWAYTSCPSNLIGQQIRAKYKASSCHNGLTGAVITCAGNSGRGSSGGGGGGVVASNGGGGGGAESVRFNNGPADEKVPVDHTGPRELAHVNQ